MGNQKQTDTLLSIVIIEKFKKGDIHAFSKIFAKLYPVICAFSRKYLKDSHESEDVTQDIFIELWNQRNIFESFEQIKAYLYISAKNKCLNIIKHTNIKEKYKQITASVRDVESSFEEDVIRTEVIAHIKNSIDKLPGQRKKVIMLSLNGYKNNEIAEELNISVNTVKLHKKLAYESLKKELKNTIFSFLLL